MSLSTGTRIGPYEVVGMLGAGGMGQVYRGRDARLLRDVALKILPAFASDPERVARFERERSCWRSSGTRTSGPFTVWKRYREPPAAASRWSSS
jgi:serine/threonine protein kinase